MSRPWKHPKTSIFWLRKRVPNDLRPLVGKREELRSLGTKDVEEAKRRFAKALSEVEERWASLRRGTVNLTEREAHVMAARIHDNWLAMHADNPSEQLIWSPCYFDRLWTTPRPKLSYGKEGTVGIDELIIDAMRRFCLQQTEFVIAERGLSLDDHSRFRLAKAVAAAFQRASLKLSLIANGEVDPVVDRSLPSTPQVSQAPVTSTPIGLSVLLDRWWQEAKAAGRKPSTFDSYRNTIAGLIRFLGHDNAERVTALDVVAFKDHRLSSASAKTVKDSDLSALKTIFGWAVSNHMLPINPAAGITIKLAKSPKLRSKSFTDEEAAAILSAALTYVGGKESLKTVCAKKWVPWLCAFTGARVGEVAQLRKEDVSRRGDVWVIRITPEAGTVKTNEAREVALHPQVTEIGFPAFVEACPDGPLFLTPDTAGNVLGPLRGLKNRLAEFARSIVADPAVAPNHGWRHRFKTIGMEAGIAPRILDAIQGQAARSVADTYGDVTIKTVAAAISRIPWMPLKTRGVPSASSASPASGPRPGYDC